MHAPGDQARPATRSPPTRARELIQIQINPEKIGLVIGPGGKTIRRLQEETGAKIDIEDTGIVTLSSPTAEGAEGAAARIQAMTEGVKPGGIYEGRVTSIKDFGAFVEILPGKDGLVHISEMSEGYVSSVNDICRVGDTMLVKVIAVDDQDRVKLSRKVAMAERGIADVHAGRERPAGMPSGGGDRGGLALPAGPSGPGGGYRGGSRRDSSRRLRRNANRRDIAKATGFRRGSQSKFKKPLSLLTFSSSSLAVYAP